MIAGEIVFIFDFNLVRFYHIYMPLKCSLNQPSTCEKLKTRLLTRTDQAQVTGLYFNALGKHFSPSNILNFVTMSIIV